MNNLGEKIEKNSQRSLQRKEALQRLLEGIQRKKIIRKRRVKKKCHPILAPGCILWLC